MRPIRPSFRRLRWKLTLTYTLITVCAFLAIALVLLAVSFVSYLASRSDPVLPREVTTRVAPTLSPYFAGEGADLEALHRWMEGARQRGIAVQGPDEEFHLNAVDLARLPVRLMVFDTDGLVVAYDDQVTALAAPLELDPAAVPGLDEVLSLALAGETDPARLQVATGSQGLTVAAPIFSDGRVRGAIVLVGPFRPPASIFLSALVPIVTGIVAFTVGAGVIGMVFGYFTARGLTRRLDRISKAASDWGSGDLRSRVWDRSADELGQLGRRLDQMAQEFQALIDARQQLSASEERNRLAQELHDSVKQQVFAISMNLAAAQVQWDHDPAAARRGINAAFDLARRSQQELSAVIQALRPPDLGGRPVCEALDELVERWARESGIPASYEFDAQKPPPPEVEDAIFRIVQEALSNVARHSSASSARVTLTVRPTSARVDVVDDGKGFDIDRPEAGMGLRSMRDRAEALNGEIAVHSSPRGTSVQVRIPYMEGASGD